MRLSLVLIAPFLLTWGSGCTSSAQAIDGDGDGVLSSEDCNDDDPRVFPDAIEACNGADDDCDGRIDEGLGDSDQDGICDGIDSEECDGLDNDGDGLVDDSYPDTDGDGVADCVDTEECDGLDNDGDGLVDEGQADSDADGLCDALDAEECDGLDNDGDGAVDEDFLDNDQDGIADCVDSEDCDGLDNDGDGSVDEGYPDTDADGTADCQDTEECDGLDNDGDGQVDEDFSDTDGDGVADCQDSEECDGLDNDGDSKIDEDFPDTDEDGIADCLDWEECDGLDNDGDGQVDEDFPDTDGDGLADCLDSEECDGLDNDGDSSVDEDFPDTDGDGTADCVDAEECDGLDNDGDGSTDEGYTDTDSDGTADCVDAEDCDGLDNDGDGKTDEDFPDSDGDSIADCLDSEECDGLDNDGDGDTDEGYTDTDGDGTADCVDTEECDGVDNDGDGITDEGIDDDADGDGYSLCDGDCDDDDITSSPGQSEAQDGSDNDCDGLIDEDWVSAGDLVITEVQIDPDAVDDWAGQYFEVLNTSDNRVYLDNWVLDSGTDSHTVDGDLSVAAGGTLVLASRKSSTVNGGFSGDYQYKGDLVLGSTGDLTLTMGSTVIDRLDWGSGTWPWATGAAMALDPAYSTESENDDDAWWCAATEEIASGGDLGTPGTANAYCGHIDHDSDGYTGDAGDCDDDNPLAYPGSTYNETGVDNDCDGTVENTPPTAVAEVTNTDTVYTCETVFLDGTNSSDADGDPILGYDWTLESAPSGSISETGDIDDASDPSPMFVPDEEGTFTFGLVVTDGADSSAMATVDVAIISRGYNDAPTADAGHDQSYSDTAACTATAYGYTCDDCSTVLLILDGTGSSDADGDDLIYSWTTPSSVASITSEDSDVATLTVSGVPATYGTTSTETIQVDLEVRDCEGEIDTDTVTFTYECTGT
jgi:hypothetical protein